MILSANVLGKELFDRLNDFFRLIFHQQMPSIGKSVHFSGWNKLEESVQIPLVKTPIAHSP